MAIALPCRAGTPDCIETHDEPDPDWWFCTVPQATVTLPFRSGAVSVTLRRGHCEPYRIGLDLDAEVSDHISLGADTAFQLAVALNAAAAEAQRRNHAQLQVIASA